MYKILSIGKIVEFISLNKYQKESYLWYNIDIKEIYEL